MLGEGVGGEAGWGWGRCSEERALTCPCAAAGLGAGRAEGARQTPVGAARCVCQTLAAVGAAGVAASKGPLSQEKGFLVF